MKTLVLWLDAIRLDYISKENMPFLSSIGKEFTICNLKPVFGYSSNLASFFTGVYPNKHDQFTLYYYNKDKKPLNNLLLKYLPKSLASYYYNLYRYSKGNDFFAPLIPYKYSKFFSLSIDKYYHKNNTLRVKTIFEVFKENKLKYILYNWPLIAKNKGSKLTFFTKSNDRGRVDKFLRLYKRDYDVYFLHLWDLDKYGHIFGPDTNKLKFKIREQDRLARRVIENFSLDHDNIIIWSDHGMLDIKKTLDLPTILPKFGKGYIYFLDSTLARFWFFNEKKRKEVMEILNQIEYGHILSANEKRKFKINFSHNLYGDEIFLVDPGVLLCPNFFQKKSIKGMHGYDLSDKNEHTFYLINRKTKSKGEIIDLFPTILECMNIQYENEIDGESLLKM